MRECLWERLLPVLCVLALLRVSRWRQWNGLRVTF
jgi:hypothetical protein